MVKDGELRLTRIINNEIEKFRLKFLNRLTMTLLLSGPFQIYLCIFAVHTSTVEFRCGVVRELSRFQMFALSMKHAEGFGCGCKRIAKTHQRKYM